MLLSSRLFCRLHQTKLSAIPTKVYKISHCIQHSEWHFTLMIRAVTEYAGRDLTSHHCRPSLPAISFPPSLDFEPFCYIILSLLEREVLSPDFLCTGLVPELCIALTVCVVCFYRLALLFNYSLERVLGTQRKLLALRT